MNLMQAQRVCMLIREHRKSLARTTSLIRRAIRVLDECPGDSALRESVLDALEGASADAYSAMVIALLAAREPNEPIPSQDDTVEKE